MKKGLCCSLTSEHAAFEGTECQDLVIDEVAQEKQIQAQKLKAEELIEAKTFGLSRIGIKNQFAAGIVLIALALIWLIGGLSINILFYYPFVLILIGFVLIIKSSIDKSKTLIKPDKSQILDDELE